jgi:hypothetical protein
MTRFRASLVCSSFTLLLLTGCGGGSPDGELAGSSGPSLFADGAKARSVAVTYAGLEADRAERLEAYEAHTLLHDTLETRLQAAGRLDAAGELEVVVNLDSFRLRSSSSAFWLGAMAGSDHVVADVRVLRDGAQVKAFKTDTSTILGGMFYASGSKRSRRLMTALAQRISAGL